MWQSTFSGQQQRRYPSLWDRKSVLWSFSLAISYILIFHKRRGVYRRHRSKKEKKRKERKKSPNIVIQNIICLNSFDWNTLIWMHLIARMNRKYLCPQKMSKENLVNRDLIISVLFYFCLELLSVNFNVSFIMQNEQYPWINV